MIKKIKTIDHQRIRTIQTKLMKWFKENQRDFPWRDSRKTKYDILIAEMMLQKTRAGGIVKTYLKFIKKYPGFQELSKASQSEIAHMIKPLGLHNMRSKNFINLCASLKHRKWKIPSSKEELLKLPGVGDYIANAYLVVALNKRVPIVDTNIKRIYNRLFSIVPTKDPRRDENIWIFCESLLPKRKYKEFNWALLDFAALVCKSKKPECKSCPLRNYCDFYQNS